MTDTMAIPVSVSKNDSIVKIITLLRDNGNVKESREVEELSNHFDFMETQFSKLIEELQGVKTHLKLIEDKSLYGTVSRVVQAAELKITEVKTQFINSKNRFIKTRSNGLNFIKEKGIAAFSKAMDFLQVKSALVNLKDKLNKAVKFVNQSVYRLEAIKEELHEVKIHKHKARRIFFGKENKPMPEYDGNRGILANIQKLLIKASGGLRGIEKTADTVIGGLENLGIRSGKNSVKGEINDIVKIKTSGTMPFAEKAELTDR